MSAKVIKLRNTNNDTLYPVSDAKYVQIKYNNEVKSVHNAILDTEETIAESHNALNNRIIVLENASYVTSSSLTTTLSSYVTSGYYDTSTHKIYLRHDTNVLSEIDTNDFIKDGMIDTAYVQGDNLVISFNTDAGKQPIQIPIVDIFNPTNYYTKTDINNAGYINSLKTINNNILSGTGNISLVTPEYLAQNYVHKPDVIYQYEDGMTKIYGQKSSSISNTWDLTNLNLSPYKYIKVFIKGSDGNNSDTGMTSPIIVTIPLDSGVISGGATYYSGAGITAGINNHNRMWVSFCAVDSTKTKFQLVRTISLYGTAGTDASDNGRFLYRIEGWYDSEEAETGGSVQFTELDPTVPSYVKNITQQDITNWNSYTNVQSDWNETDSTSNSYILNKPIIPNGLPTVSSADNGKFLQVVNGEWALVSSLNL